MDAEGDELTRLKVRDRAAVRCNVENAEVFLDYLDIGYLGLVVNYQMLEKFAKW